MNFRRGCQRGTTSATQYDPDHDRRLYGTAVPNNIPESSAWWKDRAKDLCATIEEHELGMVSSMITIIRNDLVPEMLVHIGKGAISATYRNGTGRALVDAPTHGQKQGQLRELWFGARSEFSTTHLGSQGAFHETESQDSIV